MTTDPIAAAPTLAAGNPPGNPLPWGCAEDVGLCPDRLARLDRTLEADIAAGIIPGAVIAIARHGRLVALQPYGWCDKAAGIPMTADCIFHIASMTKPMTTVGALMLYEQGKLLLGDPLGNYLPQFERSRVAVRGGDGMPTADTVAADRDITILDLMRHTCGLVYGGRGSTALHRLYPAGSSAAARELDSARFLDTLSRLPLLHQPGTVWDYGFGLDVLGLVIEAVSGQSLGDFLRVHLFEPAGMADTGFAVTPERTSRYAKPLQTALPGTYAETLDLGRPPKFDSGGAGAVSTAADYLRFALMLADRGRCGDRQLLGGRTVDYMLSDQLGPAITNLIGAADPTRADFGFGLGLAVRTTPGLVPMLGAVGQYTWPGASGTDWWVDPREGLAVVYLSASPGPLRWHYRQKINALVYQAIIA